MTDPITTTDTPSLPLRCVCEEWDADGYVPYTDVEDFLAMCLTVHGESPALRRRGDEWVNAATGAVILVPVLDELHESEAVQEACRAVGARCGRDYFAECRAFWTVQAMEAEGKLLYLHPTAAGVLRSPYRRLDGLADYLPVYGIDSDDVGILVAEAVEAVYPDLDAAGAPTALLVDYLIAGAEVAFDEAAREAGY